jgi:hypothetical protein
MDVQSLRVKCASALDVVGRFGVKVWLEEGYIHVGT